MRTAEQWNEQTSDAFKQHSSSRIMKVGGLGSSKAVLREVSIHTSFFSWVKQCKV